MDYAKQNISHSLSSLLKNRKPSSFSSPNSAFSPFPKMKTLSDKKCRNKSLINHIIKWSENKTATYCNAKTFPKSDIIEKQLFISKFFSVAFPGSSFVSLVLQFRIAFIVLKFSSPFLFLALYYTGISLSYCLIFQ